MRPILMVLVLTGCGAREPTCRDQLDALAQSVSEVVSQAERGCRADGDCVMHAVDLSCVSLGPVAVAASGAEGLSAGLSTLEPRCTGRCKGASDSFQRFEARCRSARCVAVALDGG